MEAIKLQYVIEKMWCPQEVMFAIQIGAVSTQGRCVIDAGYQKVYGSGKQSFVSVGYPEDGKAV
eukprot:761420-Ditylum_brightwellii.AAC.1